MSYLVLEDYLTRHPDLPSEEGMIICSGCSFTRGGMSEKLADTLLGRPYSGYPDLLAELLPQHTVWNAGFCGAGDQISWLFLSHLMKYKPRAVIHQIACPARGIVTEKEEQLFKDLTSFNDLQQIYGNAQTLTVEIFWRYWNNITDHSDETIREHVDVLDAIDALPCPVIFLLNNNGYPYHHQFDEIYAVVKDRVQDTCVTKFDASEGSMFYIRDDKHPNILRHMKTASILAGRIKSLLA